MSRAETPQRARDEAGPSEASSAYRLVRLVYLWFFIRGVEAVIAVEYRQIRSFEFGDGYSNRARYVTQRGTLLDRSSVLLHQVESAAQDVHKLYRGRNVHDAHLPINQEVCLKGGGGNSQPE